MVFRRLWILGLWLFGTACILGPDIEVEEQESNSPPEIVLISVEPPDDGELMLESDPECWPVEFKIGQVTDRNDRDTLYVTWFLDWERATADEQPQWSLIQPSGDITRIGPTNDIDLIAVNDDKVHTVRVFIADRAPIMDQELILRFPEGSDGSFDSYQWTFRVVDGSGYCVKSGTQ